jgi:hypothetical protein
MQEYYKSPAMRNAYAIFDSGTNEIQFYTLGGQLLPIYTNPRKDSIKVPDLEHAIKVLGEHTWFQQQTEAPCSPFNRYPVVVDSKHYFFREETPQFEIAKILGCKNLEELYGSGEFAAEQGDSSMSLFQPPPRPSTEDPDAPSEPVY